MAVMCEGGNRCLTAASVGGVGPPPRKGSDGGAGPADRRGPAQKIDLDLSGLTFTDSSGIAVILRTYRRMSQLRGGMTVVHAPDQARRVFRAAGLEKLVRFE